MDLFKSVEDTVIPFARLADDGLKAATKPTAAALAIASGIAGFGMKQTTDLAPGKKLKKEIQKTVRKEIAKKVRPSGMSFDLFS